MQAETTRQHLTEAEISRLARANRGLMRRVARQKGKRLPPGWTYDDVEQQAWVFWLKQMRRFDPSRETKATTWAHRCIRWGVGYVLQNGWEVPNDALMKARRVAAAWQSLAEELRRAPTREEVAELAGVTVKDVALWETNKVGEDRPSIHVPDEEGLTLEDRLSDASVTLADEAVDWLRNEGAFRGAVERLDERDREVVHAVFDGRTLASIGKDIGVSRERARQVYLGASTALAIDLVGVQQASRHGLACSQPGCRQPPKGNGLCAWHGRAVRQASAGGRR